MHKHTAKLLSVVMLLSLILSACGPTATPQTVVVTAPPQVVTAPPQVQVQTVEVKQTVMVEPTAAPTEIPADYASRIPIRWFVGLGAGTRPNDIESQNQVVDNFNKSQDKIYLQLEIVPNASAYQILQTEVAAGNAPDIVGPVGIRGANGFKGLWLDLAPYIAKTNYDMSDFDPGQVDFYKFAGEGQIGIPFGAYSSFIYYNKALFDEAGLPYPPHKFGEKYDGKDWDIQALEDLSMKLTVDANGEDATSAAFDPTNIVQFGFAAMWSDPRGYATQLFGPGSFVADDFATAQIPDNWRVAFNWYYDGMWNKHFMPTDTQVNSDLLANGNQFNSGHVAMGATHLWYTCCIDTGDKAAVKDWDIAVLPMYNGVYTAKLHVDTFRIFNTTAHPDEAFQVLSYLLGPAAPQLLLTYGSFPARKSLQADSIKAFEAKFAPLTIDWQVMIDSLGYPDNPSHESDMPNFLKADDRIKAFGTLYGGTEGLNIDNELDKLQADLQVIFDEVKK